jgi:arginyl-tRNA---protein transferase
MSIVHLTEAIEAPGDSPCGYCQLENSDSSSKSYFLLAEILLPQDYQVLMNRGWRRSGEQVLYLPDNLVTCCPQYSIR